MPSADDALAVTGYARGTSPRGSLSDLPVIADATIPASHVSVRARCARGRIHGGFRRSRAESWMRSGRRDRGRVARCDPETTRVLPGYRKIEDNDGRNGATPCRGSGIPRRSSLQSPQGTSISRVIIGAAGSSSRIRPTSRLSAPPSSLTFASMQDEFAESQHEVRRPVRRRSLQPHHNAHDQGQIRSSTA